MPRGATEAMKARSGVLIAERQVEVNAAEQRRDADRQVDDDVRGH